MATVDERAGAENPVRPKAAPVRLRGWKEIGRFFGVDERTAKRWEAQRGLPVHRVPGEPRAPVFAYSDELQAWVEGSRGPEPAAAAEPLSAEAVERRPWLTVALVLLAVVAGAAVWLGIQAAGDRQLAAESTEELKLLAGAQVAALNDQLDSQPGTVAVRAGLAAQAVAVLGRVASSGEAAPALRLEAAEGYRRLAVLQNAIDRPSLRDRPAALDSLSKSLALLEGDQSPEAALARARAQTELAEQVSADGKLDEARRLLADSKSVALQSGDAALAQTWWLAEGVRLGWAGDHAASAQAARNVGPVDSGGLGAATSLPAALRQVRALDLEAEALYYLGDMAGAELGYRRAIALAGVAAQRWPEDSRIRWMGLRQQWNLGSTMLSAGQSREAVPILRRALEGWEEVGRTDPSDEAVLWWVQASRLSLGQALARAGDRAGAISELSRSVAERRSWHSARPTDADRRRWLLKAEVTLAAELLPAGRTGEACAVLDEAAGIAAAMAASGQLTGYDREETMRQLEAMDRANCAARPAMAP